MKLTIEQEVSGRAGEIEGNPIVSKREIKTTVMAEDGATVVLGGLIDEDVQESESKVPLLGDIPILGHLFKSTSVTKQKRNLMVFIKATIVKQGSDIDGISKTKYNYIRAEQLKRQEEGIRLMPMTDQVVLPEWDDSLALPPTFDEYMHTQQKPAAGAAEPGGGGGRHAVARRPGQPARLAHRRRRHHALPADRTARPASHHEPGPSLCRGRVRGHRHADRLRRRHQPLQHQERRGRDPGEP